MDIDAALAAIPAEPRPLLLVLSIPGGTPEHVIVTIQQAVSTFREQYGLPPIIILRQGQELTAVTDSKMATLLHEMRERMGLPEANWHLSACERCRRPFTTLVQRAKVCSDCYEEGWVDANV